MATATYKPSMTSLSVDEALLLDQTLFTPNTPLDSHADSAVETANPERTSVSVDAPAPIDTDAMLERIDETLELIAQANQVACGAAPVAQVDISIVIPVHNCRETLPQVLERIEEVMPKSCEVILVDDGSTDGSWHYIRSLPKSAQRTILRRRRHHGRGSAIRLGLRHTSGHIVAIQDADMAYDPADLLGAVFPILDGEADVVYGSRRLRRDTRRGVGLVSRAANRITTGLANFRTGLRLSDLESSHKAFRGDLIRSMELRETDRGFDAEVTTKVARQANVVMEVPAHFEGDFMDANLAPSWSGFIQTVRSLLQYR